MSLPTWEKYVFYGVISLNLLPVFLFDFFPTLDGPAHLYNVELIRELLAGNESITAYYELQTIIVPNWLGHMLLLLFGSVLSANWAEKMMLLLYFISLPLGFRYFLRKFKMRTIGIAQPSLAVYLIFPLSYSMPLHFGFYNFSFGLVLLFTGLGYFLATFGKLNAIRGAVLGTLALLAFLAHFFVFGLLLLFIFISYITLYYSQKEEKEDTSFIKNGLNYLLYFAPALMLCGWYLSIYHFGGKASYATIGEQLSWLINARPLIYFEENEFAKFFFYTLLFWSILLLFDFFKNKVFSIGAKLMFTFLGFTLVLYFVLPNETGSAGFISIRLLLLFFLFWAAILALVSRKGYPALVLLSFTFFIHGKILDKFIKNGRPYSDLAKEIVEVSNLLEHGAKILPINASGDWVKEHYSNYLGVDKPLIILTNYEASNTYFPVRWIDLYQERVIESEMRACFDGASDIQPYYPVYNYVFLLKGAGDISGCNERMKANGWNSVYSSVRIELFKKNEQ
jgi:hypothetical protein